MVLRNDTKKSHLKKRVHATHAPLRCLSQDEAQISRATNLLHFKHKHGEKEVSLAEAQDVITRACISNKKLLPKIFPE